MMRIKYINLMLIISIATIITTSGFAYLYEWPGEKNTKTLKEQARDYWKQDGVQIKPLSLEANTKQKQYYLIQANNRKLGYGYIARVATCMPGKCPQMSSGAKREYFDYLMLLSPQGTVKALHILSYNATHGHEIRNKRWLRQFVNFAGAHKLIYGKDVQALTGATISATSMTNDVEQVVKQLQEYLQNQASKE